MKKNIKVVLRWLISVCAFLLFHELISPKGIKELPNELYKEFVNPAGIIILVLLISIGLYEYFDK